MWRGPHLPRRVERLARRSGRVLRTVIVHQNHETLYRRFVRAGAPPPTVARQGRRTFCVLNATPLTKVSAQLHGLGRQALRSAMARAPPPIRPPHSTTWSRPWRAISPCPPRSTP